MPRPVEAAYGEDVRAGPGEGRDPHAGALVSGLTESSRTRVRLLSSTHQHLAIYANDLQRTDESLVYRL